MKIALDDNALLTIPGASNIGIYMCGNPDCGMPHVVLFDDGEPMAQFVVPPLNPDGTGFLADLTNALMKGAGRQ